MSSFLILSILLNYYLGYYSHREKNEGDHRHFYFGKLDLAFKNFLDITSLCFFSKPLLLKLRSPEEIQDDCKLSRHDKLTTC
jgi:hypothetical protein